MKVKARLTNYRKSPKKVRELCPFVKGLKVSEAIVGLRNCPKGVADDLIKLIESAVANAKNNFNLDGKNLFVENLIVDEGKVMKRWRARAYGRAARILKRSCHIDLTLEELKDEVVSKKEEPKEKKEVKKVTKKVVKKEETVKDEGKSSEK